MKNTFALALVSLCFSAVSFAGTATTYTNRALEFTLAVPAMSDTISICDSTEASNCFEFNPIRKLGDKVIYGETSGKCEISVYEFSKNFAEGKTKNDLFSSHHIISLQLL